MIGYDLKMTILSFNRDNKKVLDPFYREKYGYGIDEKIEELGSKNELNFKRLNETLYFPTCKEITCFEDYYIKTSPIHSVADITVPTLFFQSRDDPAVVFDFDKEPFK